MVAGDGDVDAEGFGYPGAGEGVGGFDGEVGAVGAGVGGRFRPGDAEGACGVGDARECGLAGSVGGAAEEVFDAVGDAVVVVVAVETPPPSSWANIPP